LGNQRKKTIQDLIGVGGAKLTSKGERRRGEGKERKRVKGI